MSDNTGGSAFPTKSYDVARQTWTIEEGMTLRDYFAAKAMQGLVINKSFISIYSSGSKSVAMQAYVVADAMLKAREQ